MPMSNLLLIGKIGFAVSKGGDVEEECFAVDLVTRERSWEPGATQIM